MAPTTLVPEANRPELLRGLIAALIVPASTVIPVKAGRLRDGTSIQRGGATGVRRRLDLIPISRRADRGLNPL